MNKIYHHWQKWECYKAGFYNTNLPRNITPDEAKKLYAEFLSSSKGFEVGILGVFASWPRSCEQFLTNQSINRIAWLGQAAMCFTTGVGSHYRGGFNQLSLEEQAAANNLAEKYIKYWIETHDRTKNKTIHRKMAKARLPRRASRLSP